MDLTEALSPNAQCDRQITETALSRVREHLLSDKTVVILSGFRSENKPINGKDNPQNVKNNTVITKELRAKGFGYFYVDGKSKEELEDGTSVIVSEVSIFAIASPERSDDLIALCHKLANQTKLEDGTIQPQYSILVKTKDKNYLLLSNGTPKDLGKFAIGKMGDYYSELRNRKASKSFMFVESCDDIYTSCNCMGERMIRSMAINKHSFREIKEPRKAIPFKEWLLEH